MQRPFQPTQTKGRPRQSGPAYLWRLMCEAGSAGFTVSQLEKETTATARSTVKSYVLNLIAQGYVQRMDLEPRKSDGTFGRRRYLVVVKSRKAPVQRRCNYTGERGRARENLWIGIRMLKTFRISQLAEACTTEEVKVTFDNARAYVGALLDAGLLIALTAHLKGAPGQRPGGQPGLYKLPPEHNSGPLPPKVMHGKGVFDPNREQLFPFLDEERRAA